MAQQSYPYDAGAGAAVNEAQWQSMARRFLATGVITGSLNQLAVSADGSVLGVSVATGDAFIEGFFYRNDAALAIPLATANATNPRIDTIVVRLDRTANTAVLDKVTGTPAATPVAATLSQTDSLYELPLRDVLVPAGAGIIRAEDLRTDRRAFSKNLSERDASAAYAAKTLVDAKGDLLVGSAADTLVRRAVGANGTVLTADSAEADGVKWAATGLTTQDGVVATNETTTATRYVDLATVGPAATVTIGASGKALVFLTADLGSSVAGGSAYMAFAVSGATTRAATDPEALRISGTTRHKVSIVMPVSGLAAGSTTFTAKYGVDAGGGTASYSDRRIVVIPI